MIVKRSVLCLRSLRIDFLAPHLISQGYNFYQIKENSFKQFLQVFPQTETPWGTRGSRISSHKGSPDTKRGALYVEARSRSGRGEIFSTKNLKQGPHSRRNRNSSKSVLGGSLLTTALLFPPPGDRLVIAWNYGRSATQCRSLYASNVDDWRTNDYCVFPFVVLCDGRWHT